MGSEGSLVTCLSGDLLATSLTLLCSRAGCCSCFWAERSVRFTCVISAFSARVSMQSDSGVASLVW